MTLQSCTKTNLQRNQTNGYLTLGCKQLCFYALYIQKEQIAGAKMTMPRGNLLEVFFRLKKTLQSCTKTNLKRNQTNGVKMIGYRIIENCVFSMRKFPGKKFLG
jgi:hypothetical protein